MERTPFITGRISQDVDEEIYRTHNSKGPYPLDTVRGAAIMCNEAAEVLSEALKATAPAGSVSSYRGAGGTPQAMRYELVQVIACCVQMINYIDFAGE